MVPFGCLEAFEKDPDVSLHTVISMVMKPEPISKSELTKKNFEMGSFNVILPLWFKMPRMRDFCEAHFLQGHCHNES